MPADMKILKVSHLTEIGRVVATWAMVDYALVALAADLTLGVHVNHREDADDNAGVIPYAGMGTRPVVGLIQSLLQVRHADEALTKEWVKLAKKINEAKAQRDIIAHCVWAAGSTPEHIKPTGFKTVGGLKALRNEELRVSDLTDRASYNMALTRMIWGWRYRLNYLDPPSAELVEQLLRGEEATVRDDEARGDD